MKRKAKRIPVSPSFEHPWLPVGIAGGFLTLLPFIVSFTGLDKFRLPKDAFAAIAIALLAVVVVLFWKPKAAPPLKRWEMTLLAALCYFGIRLVVGPAPLQSWFWLLGLGLFVGLFFCLRTLATWSVQRQMWLLIGTALSLSAILTVLEYYGLFPVMLDVTGEVIAGRTTPAGFIGEVNSGGFLFGLVSIYLAYFVFAETRPWIRVLAGCLLALNLLGLLYTRTLTAILGLGVAVILWGIFHHWWHFHNGRGVTRGLLAAWIVLTVGFVGAGLIATQTGVANRVEWVVKQVAEGDLTAATAGRQPVYWLTWQMIKEKPVLGWGVNSFGLEFFDYRTGTETGQSVELLHQPGAFREAHNEYLQTWQETGVIGMILLCVLLAWPLVTLVGTLRRETDPQRQYWMGMAGVSVVFVAFSCLAFFPLHVSVTGTYVVLIFAGLRRLQSEPAPSDGNVNDGVETSSLTGWRKGLVLSAAILLLCGVGYSEIQKWLANNELGMSTYYLERVLGGQYQPAQRAAVAAKEAMRLAESAGARSSRLSDSARLRGTALMVMGRFEEAAKSYEEVVQVDPSPESYTNLAAALIEVRRFDRASECLDLALKYDPKHENALKARAFLEQSTKK